MRRRMLIAPMLLAPMLLAPAKARVMRWGHSS